MTMFVQSLTTVEHLVEVKHTHCPGTLGHTTKEKNWTQQSQHVSGIVSRIAGHISPYAQHFDTAIHGQVEILVVC